MRAVTWQGRRKVSVDTVPDPAIKEPTDAIIRVTSTNICGSDLHLYEVLGAFMSQGDILGHEAMGVVEEVGSEVDGLKPGDRVVIPFNISCGHCFMCDQGYRANARRQNRDQGTGAALFGYSKLYGEVAGGQAEYLRVPQAQYTHIKAPDDGPDERYVYLSDVLPTAWQAVEYAEVPDGGTLLVLGLGPIGSMACRIASHRKGCRLIGVDLVDERLKPRAGVLRRHRRSSQRRRRRDRDELHGRAWRRRGDRRGRDGGPRVSGRRGRPTASGFLPSPVGRVVMRHAGVDRLAALNSAISLVRRGGTISIVGVYGGAADPINMMTLFDKQIQLRMGQANVKRWVPDIMPLLTDEDPLGVEQFATHRLPSARRRTPMRRFRRSRTAWSRWCSSPDVSVRSAHPRRPGRRLVVSPSPYGTCTDLAGIAEVCHDRGDPDRRRVAIAALLFAAWVAVAAFFGPQDANNPLPGVFYVLLLVGLVALSLAVGPVWRAISPARTVYRLLGRPSSGRPYPERGATGRRCWACSPSYGWSWQVPIGIAWRNPDLAADLSCGLRSRVHCGAVNAGVPCRPLRGVQRGGVAAVTTASQPRRPHRDRQPVRSPAVAAVRPGTSRCWPCCWDPQRSTVFRRCRSGGLHRCATASAVTATLVRTCGLLVFAGVIAARWLAP